MFDAMISTASTAVCLALAALLGAAGCGPMIETAPFPVRPDSVRPADLLGPFEGLIVDADSERPVAGATVAASWAFESGIGLQAPAGAREYVTETTADGRYFIPRLDELPGGASMRLRRFTLIVYHRGHVAWRSDRLFPGRQRRGDFSQRGARVRLEAWQPTYRHADHVAFVGGGSRIRAAVAWEAAVSGPRARWGAGPADDRGGQVRRHDRDAARHHEAAQRR